LKAIILSDKTFEIREDIYKKRHFTIDIPSMYGSYHEMKFNALGLSFRLEAHTNVLFEKLIRRIDLSLITRATFYHINAWKPGALHSRSIWTSSGALPRP